MQTIHLDISNKGNIPTIYAKQGDVGKKFSAVIIDSGIPVQVGDYAFSVWYEGASGVGNYTDIGGESAINVVDNVVIVEMIAQMLNNAGDGKLCLIMANADDDEIGTWNIPYSVEAVPGLGSKPAEQYLNALADAQKKAESFAKQAEAAADRAEAVAQSSVMELIDTITIEEENIGTIARDGFALDAVALVVNAPVSATTGKIQPRFYYPNSTGGSNFITTATITVTNSSKAYQTNVDFYKHFGAWRFKWISGSSSQNASFYTWSNCDYAIFESDAPYVNKISLATTTLPIGTTIKIYGVRRNEN